MLKDHILQRLEPEGKGVTMTIKEPEPTVEPSSAFTAFVLEQVRFAALRSKITTNQLEAATVALSAGMITAEQAILILHETGLALDEVSS